MGVDEYAVNRVAALLDGGARWIAVDGLGAAGKSTLTEAVQHARPEVAVVHLDDFTRPGTVGWERERFVEQVYLPLQRGEAARYQRWHWTDSEPTDWLEIEAGAPVLIEGIGSSEAPASVHWDAVIWVAAAPTTRLRRAAQRDPGRQACWAETWRPIEDEWFTRTQPWCQADLIWVNSGSFSRGTAIR